MIKFLKPILNRLSSKIIKKYQPDIIGITGSVGKTSTKDAIYAVLSNKGISSVSEKERWQVVKSKGNFNNEVGLPLTIIGNWSDNELKLISREQPPKTKKIQKLFFWLKVIFVGLKNIVIKYKKYPEILVLEYGADRPGDIKYLLKLARPRIAVITAIGPTPVHIEFYEDAQAVAKEKSRLIEPLPVGGWAILNFDDPLVLKMKEKTRAQILTFGFNEGADVRILNFENISDGNIPVGISFKIDYQGRFIPVVLNNVFGRAQAYSVAAAFAVGLAHDLNLVEIADLVERYYLPAKHRMNLLKGVKNTWIIDDCYNAAPLSMREALNTFNDLNATRKIAVLGDMKELGKFSKNEHESIGKIVSGVADILVVVGREANYIANSAIEFGLNKDKVIRFENNEQCRREIQKLIQEGDLILVKASRGIGLEKIVDEIKEIV